MTPTSLTRAPWHLPGLADEVAAAVADLEADLRLEQAPHGLDEWDERPLQQALAAALRRTHEVALEAHYPSTAARKRSHRPRCDLVLSPRGLPLEQDAVVVGVEVRRQQADRGEVERAAGDQLVDEREPVAPPVLMASSPRGGRR